MVWRQYCDICGLEIPHVPDDFCVEEMQQLSKKGTFEETGELNETLFEVDMCHVCMGAIKSFILKLMNPQSFDTRVSK